MIDLDRSGTPWKLDPRLRADQQTGEMVYAGNDIDRGHLVRRASAVWGDTRAEAARANADTFHYTNAAPQAAKFNQGMDLWLGLESYLLDNAADNGRRLVVFTGPIFSDTDPVYRGVRIPLKFFKVAAFIHHGSLDATGYVVDQTPQLADIPEVPWPGALDEAPPPTGFVPNIPGTHQRYRGADRTRLGTTDRRRPDAHCVNPAHRRGRFNLAATENTTGP